MVLLEQGVSNRLCVRKNNGAILASQPLRHSVRQFDDRHRIPVSFVADELVIPLRKQREIGFRRFAPRKLHFCPTSKMSHTAAWRASWLCRRRDERPCWL